MDDNGADVAAFVARVDRDRLAAIILDPFRAEIPGYARLPASALRGQVVHVIRQNVDLCLDWVAGGGAPDPARFEDFRESAKNRASEGMPLEDLLRAYRVGGTAAWRVLVAEARGGERDKLPRVAELVMTYLDKVSGIVAEAYLDERQHLVSEQERGVRALLVALLDGDVLDARHYETAAHLGFDVGGKLRTFAAAIPGEGATAHARAAARLRTLAALAVTEGDRVVGVAPVQVPASAVPTGGVVVVADQAPREELAASLADVRLGIEIALRAGRSGVLELHTLTLDLLLARAPRVAADLRKRILLPLGPKGGRGRADLLKTLSTYITLHRDRQRTAARLHVHPNTLDHRLRRARELTGLNLDDPADL